MRRCAVSGAVQRSLVSDQQMTGAANGSQAARHPTVQQAGDVCLEGPCLTGVGSWLWIRIWLLLILYYVTDMGLAHLEHVYLFLLYVYL